MTIDGRPRTEASILHADLDSFYASVEQRDDPALRGCPVLVGGSVVVAASYEAKALGVRTPMPGHQARALCRGRAITVSPRFAEYTAASRAVFAVFEDTTPAVEGLSVDEAFLDVAGLRRIAGTPVQIAERLRHRIRAEVGLPITIGVARTKFLAKVASGAGKPDGLLEVAPDAELEFLRPLPVRSLWGVGAKTEQRLVAAGITRVGQLADLGEERLSALLGPGPGGHLYALATAHDPRPVQTGRRRRSIGAQRALGRGPKDPDELAAVLMAIVDGLGRRLRAAQRHCRTVVLRLRFDDFGTATRSRSVRRPTDSTAVLLAVAEALLDEAMPLLRGRGCTLIGLSLTNLGEAAAEQLTFTFGDGEPARTSPEATDRRVAGLDRMLDQVRDRYGRQAITRGRLVHRPSPDETPRLPD